MGQPRPLFCLFLVFFKQKIQFLQQINVKNVHPVYGTGIQTHDLLNMSRHPLPLDQGSRPKKKYTTSLLKSRDEGLRWPCQHKKIYLTVR